MHCCFDMDKGNIDSNGKTNNMMFSIRRGWHMEDSSCDLLRNKKCGFMVYFSKSIALFFFLSCWDMRLTIMISPVSILQNGVLRSLYSDSLSLRHIIMQYVVASNMQYLFTLSNQYNSRKDMGNIIHENVRRFIAVTWTFIAKTFVMVVILTTDVTTPNTCEHSFGYHLWMLGLYSLKLPRTKWPPFRRRYFQMHFLEWKCIDSDSYFTEVCS